MEQKSNSPKELLSRAYALSSDEETRALYRDWASTYDETMMGGLDYLTPQKTAKLLSTVVKDKTVRVLDVGAGTGLAGQSLAELGFANIDALDYSNAMLGVAKLREQGGKPVYQNCIQADLNKRLTLEDNAYDAMICTGLFTHAHVGANCLPELFRILKPASYFATTVHKDIWKSSGFDVMTNTLEAQGLIKTHSSIMDIFFKTDEEPQGSYIVWKTLK